MRLLAWFVILLGALAIVPQLQAAEQIMVDKNLFAQDRKPPPADLSAAAAQPGKPGVALNAIQLDGVMIQGDTKKALLRLKSPPAQADRKKNQSPYVTVHEGQRVGDFQVVKIEPKSVSLEKDGQVSVLSLFSEGKVSPQVPSPPVPPGPPVGAPQGQAPDPAGAGNVPVRQPGAADGNAAAGGSAANVTLPQPAVEVPAPGPGVHPDDESQEDDEAADETGQ